MGLLGSIFARERRERKPAACRPQKARLRTGRRATTRCIDRTQLARRSVHARRGRARCAPKVEALVDASQPCCVWTPRHNVGTGHFKVGLGPTPRALAAGLPQPPISPPTHTLLTTSVEGLRLLQLYGCAARPHRIHVAPIELAILGDVQSVEGLLTLT